MLVPVLPLLLQQGVVIQHDVFASDLLHSQLPYRAFVGAELAAGRFPTWMPGIYSGIPLLAQIEAGALYLPHSLLFAAVEPFTALNLALLLDLLVAAGGAFHLARRQGRSPAAAAFAAVVFAWSGFFVSHVRHLNMHAAASLLPWIFAAFDDLLEGRRAGPRLALLFGLQLAAGHPQISHLTGLVLGLRGLGAVAADRRRLRGALGAAAALGLGGLLLAVQLLPTWAFVAQSLGTTPASWEQAAQFPLRWADLAAFAWPPAVGAMESYDYAGVGSLPWENYGYVGLLGLGLAALGLAVRAPGRAGWAGLLLLGLAMALGPNTPLYRWAWETVPGMAMFRFPNRFLLIVDLALPMLAAAGLDLLIARVGRLGPGLAAAALLFGLADQSAHARVRMPIEPAGPWRDAPPLPGLDGPGRYAVLDEYRLWERAFRAGQRLPDPLRPLRELWPLPLGSAGLLRELRAAGGYARMVGYRTAAFWQRYNHELLPHVYRVREPTPDAPRLSPALRSLFSRAGVDRVVSALPLEDLEPVGGGVVGVYANPDALPWAYLAGRWKPVADLDAAAAWVLREGVDQLDVPAIEGAPPSPATGTAVPLRVEVHSAAELTLRVEGAGWLVLGESWDPGWSAHVDGVEVPVHVANGWQMAVRVEGPAELRFRYRPPGLGPGLAGSGAAALLIGAWAALGARRRGAAA